MTEDWTDLIGLSGVPIQSVKRLLKSWHPRARTARLASLRALVGAEGTDPLWPTRMTPAERLRGGIYSPMQPLAYECARECRESVERDFPFLFEWSALIIDMMTRTLNNGSGGFDWPPTVKQTRGHRRLLQSVFRLRELREEHEPLSIEIELPLSDKVGTFVLPAKKLAQVFGRGVALSSGRELQQRSTTAGRVTFVFRSHKRSPSTRLYTLEPPFAHVEAGRLNLTLRRDGLLSLAMANNPLLEFYDGGWHVVDIESGRMAVDSLLRATFGNEVDLKLPPLLIALAHHMASHWHGGILAVCRPPDVKGVLQDQLDTRLMTDALCASSGMSPGSAIKLTDVGRDTDSEDPRTGGYGRVFLTLAIQDGATIFAPDGTFHSAARFVNTSKDPVTSGGAGARAAKSIARYGVVLKVSADGGIKVFAAKGGQSLVPDDGLRIR